MNNKEVKINSENTSMEIFAINGHKIRCKTLSGGYQFHEDIANTYLTLNNIYTVDHTEVGSWHTDVFLLEFPNVAFNSIFFEDVEPQDVEVTKTHPDMRRYI